MNTALAVRPAPKLPLHPPTLYRKAKPKVLPVEPLEASRTLRLNLHRNLVVRHPLALAMSVVPFPAHKPVVKSKFNHFTSRQTFPRRLLGTVNLALQVLLPK